MYLPYLHITHLQVVRTARAELPSAPTVHTSCQLAHKQRVLRHTTQKARNVKTASGIQLETRAREAQAQVIWVIHWQGLLASRVNPASGVEDGNTGRRAPCGTHCCCLSRVRLRGAQMQTQKHKSSCCYAAKACHLAHCSGLLLCACEGGMRCLRVCKQLGGGSRGVGDHEALTEQRNNTRGVILKACAAVGTRATVAVNDEAGAGE